MSGEWHKNFLIPIYENKGDIRTCGNYRGIKLMFHTMKHWEYESLGYQITNLDLFPEDQYWRLFIC